MLGRTLLLLGYANDPRITPISDNNIRVCREREGKVKPVQLTSAQMEAIIDALAKSKDRAVTLQVQKNQTLTLIVEGIRLGETK